MYPSHPAQDIAVIKSRYMQSDAAKHVNTTRFAPFRLIRRVFNQRQSQ